MPARPALRRLADALGILPAYTSQQGGIVRTADRTIVALCRALGVEAGTEAACRAALDGLADEHARHPIARTRVVGRGRAAARLPVVWPTDVGPCAWRVTLRLEDGSVATREGRIGGHPPVAVTLPAAPPLGYHTVELALAGPGGAYEARQRLIVTPSSCPRPGRQRRFGITANLYTLRREAGWGIGDLGDLRMLVRWSGRVGAAFVGLNPLHALDPGAEPGSPYSPTSRLYREPLYLDVMRVPELADASDVRRRLDRAEVQRELRTLRAAPVVDYGRVRLLKRAFLAALYARFVARHGHGCTTARGRAFEAYCAREGDALVAFARHMAGRDAAVGLAHATPVADPIDFHCWLQFELDRQLAEIDRLARRRDVPLGLYHDLALGSARDGSDTTSFPDLFVDDANVGAPPDDYSRRGQDWGLPPLHPHRLTGSGYDYWIRLVRASLRHAGVLRLDHVMGLARQYWIPRGRPGTEGAYVRFPADDLLGILALEAARSGTLIVGEDIGTVPRGFRTLMRRWSVLSSRVLYFERSGGTGFRGSSSYPAHALVTANNHDLPPLAGWWRGRDLSLRAEAGLLDRRRLGPARGRRARERAALVRRLGAEGCLPASARPTSAEIDAGADPGSGLVAAVHRFLRRTPATLVGLALDDLGGEVDPVNLPGTVEEYPSWRRRMQRTVDDLTRGADVARALGGRTRRRIES